MIELTPFHAHLTSLSIVITMAQCYSAYDDPLFIWLQLNVITVSHIISSYISLQRRRNHRN